MLQLPHDQLTINGHAITEKYLPPGQQVRVTDPNARFDITVPAGKVWVLGDNRADSGDSRVHNDRRQGRPTERCRSPTSPARSSPSPGRSVVSGDSPTYGAVFADVPKPKP